MQIAQDNTAVVRLASPTVKRAITARHTAQAKGSAGSGTSSRCDSTPPRSTRSLSSSYRIRSCSACWSMTIIPSLVSAIR